MTRQTTWTTPTARQRGFTLVEMLMALVVSAIVGVTVMMMLWSSARATQSQHESRRASIERQVAIARIASVVRSSATVLASDAAHLVLWKGDTTRNGKPDRSELRMIVWDVNAKEVATYEAPEPVGAGSDVTYEMTDDFIAITTAMAGSDLFPRSLSLDGVSAWDVTLDAATPQAAQLARVHMDIESENGEQSAVIVSALRAGSD